ncbi:glycosyltransferase family 4 protein [Sedimentitalea sp.]|uniref:glycosyltransferase family 4 protein n=1 Tax=Sedimentitalea sp. TaxID=2048915 RepID=UPI0032981DE3
MPHPTSDIAAPSSEPHGKIAYLTGEYPKVSHTFIQREVAALRAHGADVLTCTVRRANPVDVVGTDQKAEEAETFCILHEARAPHRLIGAHLSELLRAPRRWVSALQLAWQTRPPGAKALLYQLFYFAEAGVLAAHLRKMKVVHLHNHFGNSSCSVAMLCSELSGIPFSFTEHGPAIFFEPMHWRIDEKIARARFVVSISHFCRSQLMLFSDEVHWPKISIVHCGVQPENYGRTPREKFGKRVLFVGRLGAVKGVPLLLEAFASLATKHPDAQLTIVGDGEDRSRLEAQAQTLRVAEAVDFVGYQPQDAVAAFLEDADMLALPSFAEGVPVVLMEAMASRIPVIASRVAGVPELVQDGVTGFVIPPGDVKTLSERIDQLLSDPNLCRRMGETGRDIVSHEFSINHEGAWLLQILRGQVEPGTLRP